MKAYFKTKDGRPAEESHGGGGGGFTFDDLAYETDGGSLRIEFYEYEDAAEVERLYGTNKKYIVGIDKEDYSIAQKALR